MHPRAGLLSLFLVVSGCRAVLGFDDGHPAGDGDGGDAPALDAWDLDTAADASFVDGLADTSSPDASAIDSLPADVSDTRVPSDVVGVDTRPEVAADSGFVSTPGSIDCAGTPCNFGTGDYCCQASPFVCSKTSCPVSQHYMCDEMADCVAFGYGAVACCAGATGGVVCQDGCPAPRTQFCMTNAECPSGSCVATGAGPGKAPHGECAR